MPGEFVMPEAVTVRPGGCSVSMKPAEVASVARPRRILFLVTEDWYFVSHRLALAVALREAGWDVHVACSINNHRNAIADHGITIHPVIFSRESLSPWSVLRTATQIRQLLARVAPSVVCPVALRPILVCRMAMIGDRNAPCLNLLTGRGSLYSGKASDFRMRLVRLAVDQWLRFAASRRQNHTVAQNLDDLHYLGRQFGLTTDACTLIRGSGIKSSAWTPLPEPADSPFRLIYVGRLLRDKAAGDLVDASQLLIRKGFQVRVELVGDIDESNPECYPLGEVRYWQKLPGIQWKGRRNDVLEQISSAHVLVHPSHYGEGLPRVILEAGLCERAVVTCDTVGCREVVRDGENGLLVAPRNPEALAKAVERLGCDPRLRRRLAARHRQRVLTEFADEIILPQYIQLIDGLVKRFGS